MLDTSQILNETKVPCEKLIELLFTRHALNICGDQTVLYAPSNREEYLNGYDAKFMGSSGCRELYLQFKKPYFRKDELFTVSLNNHQHSRLRGYPRGTSFYVSHSFSSIKELQDCQLSVTNSREFLKYFIVVESHALPKDTNFFRFARDAESFPMNPKFKHDSEGKIKKTRNDVDADEWCDGISVLERFKRGEAGCVVEFADSPEQVKFIGSLQNDVLYSGAFLNCLKATETNRLDSQFGIHLRKIWEHKSYGCAEK